MKISNLFIDQEMYEINSCLHSWIIGLNFDIEFFLAKNNFSLSLSRTFYRNVTRYTTPPRKIKGKKVHIILFNIHLFVPYLF